MILINILIYVCLIKETMFSLDGKISLVAFQASLDLAETGTEGMVEGMAVVVLMAAMASSAAAID